ncbi:hypothetical protein MIR68_000458 [Amoeboaphelidium protococcarum]|nr:hypothetical protein MIR68_000458 [Amoeboaphelidium protococcarum]
MRNLKQKGPVLKYVAAFRGIVEECVDELSMVDKYAHSAFIQTRNGASYKLSTTPPPPTTGQRSLSKLLGPFLLRALEEVLILEMLQEDVGDVLYWQEMQDWIQQKVGGGFYPAMRSLHIVLQIYQLNAGKAMVYNHFTERLHIELKGYENVAHDGQLGAENKRDGRDGARVNAGRKYQKIWYY